MTFIGVTKETINRLSTKLIVFHESVKYLFRTKTRDISHHALTELKGSLLMENNRTYTNVSRKVIAPLDDGQNIQHFMSDSPWAPEPVFTHICQQISANRALGGGMLCVDESGDECSSTDKACSGRQYFGRSGKVDVSQVAVVASYRQSGIWALVDAQLYFPQVWFTPAKKALWKKLHIPDKTTFKTKLDIAKDLIDRAIANGLDFSIVGADNFYGRDGDFRDFIASKGKLYLCCTPCDTMVYLTEPQIGIPEKKEGRGRVPIHQKVLNQEPVKVNSLIDKLDFETIEIRNCERGKLIYKHAFIPVWTLRETIVVQEDGQEVKKIRSVKELLIIRLEHTGKYSYSLTNAPTETDHKQLALWRSDRYFVERTIQDTKTQAGWDELLSGKYRAYMHRIAIDALALWFIATVKLEEREYLVDNQYIKEREPIPDLSFANVRQLLLVTFPLKELSEEQAIKLVNKHLINRTKSTKSRLKKYAKGI